MIDISKLSQNATAVNIMPNSRNKVTTIDEARQKVADKLEKNWRYILNKMPENEKIDKVFTEEDGTYTLGIKFGNRWLKHVFGQDQHFVTGISYDDLEETVDVLITCVMAGELDDSIKEVMKANKASKLKGEVK